MKVTTCDRCKASSAEPKNWYHESSADKGRQDFCHFCTRILVEKGLDTELEEEIDRHIAYYKLLTGG